MDETRETIPWRRWATTVALAEASPDLGRTALMKFMYFLQTLRGVPLGYQFSLYMYGPFDSRVLGDLSALEGMGAVRSERYTRPTGYGYSIKPGEAASFVKGHAEQFLRKHKQDIAWVTDSFGKYSPAELELLSTLVYADRENVADHVEVTLGQLTDLVLTIKPRFDKGAALAHAQTLAGMRVFKAVRG